MSEVGRILSHLNAIGLSNKDPQLYQVLAELIRQVDSIVIPPPIPISKFLYLTPVLFGQVQALAKEGTVAAITDSNTNVPGAIIAGGGTDHIAGYFDGTNWIVL